MKKKWIIIVGAVLLVGIFTTIAFADNPIKLFVNGQEIKPDVPPQLINGRTMVPIRWVAEALGADVQWDAKNQQVKVSQPPDIWNETLTITADEWIKIRSLLSQFYLATDWQDDASWKQVVTNDINVTLPVAGDYPTIVDWRVLDGRKLDKNHIQLRVKVVHDYYGDIYEYLEDVTVDMQQNKVSRVNVGERKDLSSVTVFNGLTLTK